MAAQLEMFPVEELTEKRLRTAERRVNLLFSERAIVEEEIRELKRQVEQLWLLVGELAKKTP